MGDKKLSIDNEVHELKFGSSFDPKSTTAFHSIRYDFKPASVDTANEALVEVGEGHQITVNVPHVEGSGTTHTVYKGNKRELPKECVLIIDHATGSFTLERLKNNIQLKKTRMEGTSKVSQAQGRPLTPVDYNKQKMSPVKPKATPSQISPPSTTESPSITPVHSVNSEETPKDGCLIGEISDSSSSDDSDSDSDDDHSKKPNNPTPPSMPALGVPPSMPALGVPPSMPALGVQPSMPKSFGSLENDLRLSESSSSDSD